jgi:hypothetical protein
MTNYVFRVNAFGLGELGGVASMVRDRTDDLLRAYLADLINSRLRRDVPGLYASLSMMTYSRYGKYPGELLYDDPKSLVKLLREHFMDDEMVLRILKYMLEPIENLGAFGKKSVDALMKGDYDDFKKYLREALIKEAHRWTHKLLK